MFLQGVAVLELDSHPDNNKGPDPRTLRQSSDPSPFINPNYTTYQTTNPLIAHIFLGVLTVLMHCACLGPRHSNWSHYYCRASDLAATVQLLTLTDRGGGGYFFKERVMRLDREQSDLFAKIKETLLHLTMEGERVRKNP